MDKKKNVNINLKILCCIMLCILFCCTINIVQAAVSYKTGIENFPKSYQGYLLELQKKHPTWAFVAMYTGLDYTNSIKQESYIGRGNSISLVYKAWDKSWHYYKNGSTIQIEQGWVTASKAGVEYTMDPRNFLNEESIFQFLDLKYNPGKQTLKGVEQILYGTEMSEVYYEEGVAKYKIKEIEYWAKVDGELKYIKYLYDKDGDGVKESPLTYAEAFMLAAEKSNISPYTIALRNKSETSCKITTDVQLSGKNSTYPATYNYYSIGAYGSNPALNGLAYANSKGWHDPVTAIVEGAIWWGESYIMAGQNTGYLQKFNVNPEAESAVYNHQYMTNITCAYKEALGLYDTYQKLGMIEDTFVFVIPVFENMSETSTDIYTMYDGAYSKENEIVKVTKDTSLYAIMPTTTTGTRVVEMAKIPAGSEIQKIYSGITSSYDKVCYEVDGNKIYGYIYYNTYEIATNTDNTKLKVITSPSLNMRKSPTTSSLVIKSIPKGEIITRIEKNSSIDGTGVWDKVKLKDGTVGYICRKTTSGDVYVTEYEYIKVTDIILPNENIQITAGESVKLGASVMPNNAEFPALTYVSSDKQVANVDENGNVTGIKKGETTIKIINEDDGIVKECKVTVEAKIKLDKELYVISIGSSVKPDVQILGDEDTNYMVEIYSEELLNQDNVQDVNIYGEEAVKDHVIQIKNNEVYGLNQGLAKIRVYTSNLEAFATVKVSSEKLEVKFNLPFEEQTENEEKLVARVSPGYTPQKFSSNISTNGKIKYLNTKGEELVDTQMIATGTKLVILFEEETEEYTVVIKGDINGDSKISASDYVMCKNYIMGTKELSGVYKNAADINRDGKVSASDYVKCKNYIMGTANIEF